MDNTLLSCLDLYWARVGVGQSIQTAPDLHRQRGGDVPGSCKYLSLFPFCSVTVNIFRRQ